MTIVISRSNQQLVVLRNGREIGRANIQVPNTDFETHVLTLGRNAAGALNWMLIGVPGHSGVAAPIDASIVSQLKMPNAFIPLVNSVLQPGTTVLVTEATITSQTTGKVQMVLASQ